MMPRRSAAPVMLVLLLEGALLFCAEGCSSDGEVDAGEVGSVVAGVTSDLVPGTDMARLGVTLKADGRVLRDDVVRANDKKAPLAFPMELGWGELPVGTRVDLRLSAFQTYYSDEEPLILREAWTRVAPGGARLLRARIERECIPNARLSGDLIAPTCESPETCIGAACVNPYVPPENLEVYSPTWPDAFEDACKSLAPGEPEVVIGQGQGHYEALTAGSVVGVEAGSQGGYHIWVSVRMKSLHREGSRTTVEVYGASSEELLQSVVSMQAYDAAPEGYCELTGLRCQLSLWNGAAGAGLLGSEVRIVVKVADASGDVGVSEQVVTLSKEIVK